MLPLVLVAGVGLALFLGRRAVAVVKEVPQVRDLAALDPTFRPKAEQLLRDAETIGIPLKVVETRRTRERQAWLYGQGRPGYTYNGVKYGRIGLIVTKAKPGSSRHELGRAIDVWPKGLTYSAEDVKRAKELLERVESTCAIRIGLRNEPIKDDFSHFEEAAS